MVFDCDVLICMYGKDCVFELFMVKLVWCVNVINLGWIGWLEDVVEFCRFFFVV